MAWYDAPLTSGFMSEFWMDSGGVNKGHDYGVPVGTPIDALVGGTVISAGDSGDGWGYSVKIRDAQGRTHNYGHLSQIGVRPGDVVQAGASLGKSGGVPGTPGAGTSSGAHLSYDVWDPNGQYIDPATFIEPARTAKSAPKAKETGMVSQNTEMVTGADITSLGIYLANLLAQQQLGAQGQAGYFDPSTFGAGGINGFMPTLARDQFQASKDAAERQYGLDLQRFGLDVAQFNFNQRLGEEAAKMNRLDLLSGLSGPGDFVRYNYVLNDMAGEAPLKNTVNPLGNLNINSPFSAPTQAPRTQQQAAPPPAPTIQNTFQQTNRGGAGGSKVGTSTATFADGSSFTVDQNRLDTDKNYLGLINQAMTTGQKVPGLAHGGLSDGSGAIVGDPKPGSNKPNPEFMRIVQTPDGLAIEVTPLDQMGMSMGDTEGMPKYATGGFFDFGTYDPTGFGDMPFARKQRGELPSVPFRARGEDLGSFGKNPLSYTNFLSLMPSEQAQLQGLIETPTELGGYGGYFPDELERARRSAATGATFSPGVFG